MENIHEVSLAPEGFSLHVKPEGFEVLVGGVPYFDLNARSSVEAEGESADQDLPILAFEKGENEGRTFFTWTTCSNLWEKKVYRLDLYPEAFTYRVFVTGKHALGRIEYFSGGGQPGAKGSAYEASRYLEPHPGGGPTSLPQYRSICQPGRVGLGYLVPPLLAFPFTLSEPGHPWVALGLAARPGEWDLDHFATEGSAKEWTGRFVLSTDFLGYKQVDGEYELPAITGTMGADEFLALDGHAQWLYDHGGCQRRDWCGSPRWWYGPLYCGWGEQDHYAPSAQEGATQAAYTDMSRRLDERGLKPTAIIIDDKWQTWYGEALPDEKKWPDLRGFTDDQHARGRKVLLWFKAWNSSGLPADECVNLWSQPLGADPNSPAYQERLRAFVAKLLGDGEGCYNCDGFKVDFANVMPLGKNLRGATSHYGIELLKQWFDLFYSSAKAVKPDCLINASCAHPYFAGVTDQARLHDYWGPLHAAWEVMSFRHRLFQAGLPGVLIDSDGVSSSRRETMDYFRRCPELGIPDLYWLTSHNMTEEDWVELREIWEEYSASLDGSS